MSQNRIAPFLGRPGSASGPSAHQRFFLIAEDDPDDRMLLAEAFASISEEAPTIHLVEDGDQLMEYLLKPGRRPDFLLLDLSLPKKDGIEALTEIRRTPSLEDLPVVVLTGSKSSLSRIMVQQFSKVEFVTKPFEFQDLLTLAKHLTTTFYGSAV